MSYSITCDGYTIYAEGLDDYVVTKAVLRRELNKADSFTFTIYPNHPNFSTLHKLKSDIVVWDGSNPVFLGRILDEALGWNNEITCVCEGAFAWLNDTIQRPFSFPVDPEDAAPEDYLAFLIARHNGQVGTERQIAVGDCTVTDPNNYIARSDTEYSTTYRLLKEGLLDTLGGYFYTSYSVVNGAVVATLNYHTEAGFDTLGNQPVKFGLNMLSLNTAKKGDSIATAILPLGAKDEVTGARLTISGLEDSTWDDVYKSGDIVYSSTAETLYGSRIIKTVIWDDVTIAANLLTKAREQLAQDILAPQTVSITAADLSKAGYSYNTFSLGLKVEIIDTAHGTAHGLSQYYLVSKLSTDLLNPANNKLSLGATTYSLIEGQQENLSSSLKRIEGDLISITEREIRELRTYSESAIMQGDGVLLFRVGEDTYVSGYASGDVDQLIESKSTQLTQDVQGWLYEFREYVGEIQEDGNTKFDEIYSYISFAGGSITLGKGDSEITLKIQNDEIGIYRHGVLITYWRADRQYTPSVLEVPVGGKVIFGNYAFIPRTNGSLDLSWIGV